jgi:hypothetical protein
MKTTIRIVLAGILALFAAQAALQAQGERKLQPFDGISVTGNIEVILEKGEEEKAEIYAEGVSEDEVSVFLSRGELKIKMLNSLFSRNQSIKVHVTYRELRTIRAHAGARIGSEEVVRGDKVHVRATSGARIDLAVEVNALKGEATEGGIVELRGKTTSQDATAATGGQYLGLDLASERTYVRANTGGKASVVAFKLLDAAANTGGAIEYEGNPEEKYTRSVIAGEIRKI